MRKLWITILTALVFLFFSVTLLPAPVDKCEEEKAQIAVLNSELATTYAALDVKELEVFELQTDLTIAYDDLNLKDVEIIVLEQQIATAYDKVDKQAVEITVLEDKLAQCYATVQKPINGIWVGANTGIPFGVLGTVGYQFNERFMVKSALGYMGQFQWQVGFSTRIGR